MRGVMRESRSLVLFSGVQTTDLDLTDDAVEEVGPLGLRVSWIKTKI